jgi:hypothetical protein
MSRNPKLYRKKPLFDSDTYLRLFSFWNTYSAHGQIKPNAVKLSEYFENMWNNAEIIKNS